MSLLGNTYSRIAAKKIQARVGTDSPVSAATLAGSLSSSSETLSLLTALRDNDEGLSRTVERHMNNLEIADALDKIMDTLTKVRGVRPCSRGWR